MNNAANFREILEERGRLIFTPGGTSMRPMLKHHETPVVCLPIDRSKPLKKYDVIFYQRDNGQYVLHRIVKVCKDSYVCCGDGQIELEYGVRDDMIFAVLEGYCNGDRYIRTNGNFLNRVYAVWRVAGRPARKAYNVIKSHTFSKALSCLQKIQKLFG